MGQGMPIIVVSLALGALMWGLIARWYVMPVLATRPRAEALIPLLVPHALRYVGLGFIVVGVVAPEINPTFAQAAAYGDLLASVLALLAIVALRLRWALAIPLVWVFNIEGTLDMLYVVSYAIQHVDAGQLGGMYFVPTLLVPIMLVTHIMIFQLLLRRMNLEP